MRVLRKEIEDLFLAGLSKYSIAKKLGIARTTVRYHLRELGYPLGRAFGPAQLKLKDGNEVVRLYFEELLGIREIGLKLAISPSTVRAYVHRAGKQLRTAKEGFNLARHKGNFHQHSGSNHPNWRGGITRHGDGYIMLKRPAHHRANHLGYVMEHILVWEKANGQELPDGWVIHHLNGIKDDNRPENLIAQPFKEHDKLELLHKCQARIRELEAQIIDR